MTPQPYYNKVFITFMLFLQQKEQIMKKLQILKQCSLFKGIDPAEIEKLLNCLKSHEKQYQKTKQLSDKVILFMKLD